MNICQRSARQAAEEVKLRSQPKKQPQVGNGPTKIYCRIIFFSDIFAYRLLFCKFSYDLHSGGSKVEWVETWFNDNPKRMFYCLQKILWKQESWKCRTVSSEMHHLRCVVARQNNIFDAIIIFPRYTIKVEILPTTDCSTTLSVDFWINETIKSFHS